MQAATEEIADAEQQQLPDDHDGNHDQEPRVSRRGREERDRHRGALHRAPNTLVAERQRGELDRNGQLAPLTDLHPIDLDRRDEPGGVDLRPGDEGNRGPRHHDRAGVDDLERQCAPRARPEPCGEGVGANEADMFDGETAKGRSDEVAITRVRRRCTRYVNRGRRVVRCALADRAYDARARHRWKHHSQTGLELSQIVAGHHLSGAERAIRRTGPRVGTTDLELDEDVGRPRSAQHLEGRASRDRVVGKRQVDHRDRRRCRRRRGHGCRGRPREGSRRERDAGNGEPRQRTDAAQGHALPLRRRAQTRWAIKATTSSTTTATPSHGMAHSSIDVLTTTNSEGCWTTSLALSRR